MGNKLVHLSFSHISSLEGCVRSFASMKRQRHGVVEAFTVNRSSYIPEIKPVMFEQDTKCELVSVLGRVRELAGGLLYVCVVGSFAEQRLFFADI